MLPIQFPGLACQPLHVDKGIASGVIRGCIDGAVRLSKRKQCNVVMGHADRFRNSSRDHWRTFDLGFWSILSVSISYSRDHSGAVGS